jgi:cytochrome c1
MSNTRDTKRAIRRLEQVKTWQLIVLLILSLFVSATLLRLNNVGMVERRESVYAADKAADDDEVLDRLYDLQRYASSHMNASTGDVYLDKKYQRDVERVVRETEVANRESSDRSAELLYQAYAICRDRFPGYSSAYTQCVGAEQDKIPENAIGVTRAEFPPVALYKHNFISPVWSPDFAGWSVLITVFLGVAVIIRFIVGVYLRWRLKRTYRSLE